MHIKILMPLRWCLIFLLVTHFNENLFSQLSTENLIAYYPLNGDVMDYGPSGYHGIMNGGTFVTNAAGIPNSALQLDGINDYVDITAFANNFRDSLGLMTIYFLVKFESTSTNQTILSLGNHGESLNSNVFEVEFENNHFQVETEISPAAINIELEIDQTPNVVDLNWHEIFIRINGDSLDYCRDGELVYSGLYTPAETTTDELFLGCFDGDGINDCCHFNGIIDELQFYSSLKLEVNDTLIHTSCESEEYQIVVNNTVYDITNPSGTEIIQSDCFRDTILTIALEFSPSYEITIEETFCEGDNYSIEINGTIYNENNPVGVEVFDLGQCDSVVNVNLQFFETSTDSILYLGCNGDGFSITVNQVIYDEANPQGIEVMQNIWGCDSIIVINLNFISDAVGAFSAVACKGDNYSIEINGTIYDEDNPVGVEIFNLGQCDSIVTVNLEFMETSTDSIGYYGCEGDGYSIMVNQIIYNETNPQGMEVMQNIGGCDSIIIVNLNFTAALLGTFNVVACAGDNYSIEINGTVYNENNPIGVEVFNLGQCDSIVTINLEFVETSTDSIGYYGCIADEYSIRVNDVIYDENNPQGVEVLQNIGGCDSLVYIDLEYVEDDCSFFFPNIINTRSEYPNNTFQIFTSDACEYRVEKFLIFNRWGGTIYGDEKLATWDGSFKGKKIEQGVYVYYLIIETQCSKVTKTGTVILLN